MVAIVSVASIKWDLNYSTDISNVVGLSLHNNIYLKLTKSDK